MKIKPMDPLFYNHSLWRRLEQLYTLHYATSVSDRLRVERATPYGLNRLLTHIHRDMDQCRMRIEHGTETISHNRNVLNWLEAEMVRLNLTIFSGD